MFFEKIFSFFFSSFFFWLKMEFFSTRFEPWPGMEWSGFCVWNEKVYMKSKPSPFFLALHVDEHKNIKERTFSIFQQYCTLIYNEIRKFEHFSLMEDEIEYYSE